MAHRTAEEEARDLSSASKVLYGLGEKLRAKVLEKPLHKKQVPLVFFFARGFMTFQATIRLWEEGFWRDAAVLSRSLREASYQARWVAKSGDRASRLFMRDFQRNWRKVMRTLGSVGEPEVKAKAQKIVADMKPAKELDAWWKNWWGRKKSIGWLAKQIGARDAYLVEYATLSAFVHSSPAIFPYYVTPLHDGGMTLHTRPILTSEDRDFAHAILWTTLAAFADLCSVLDSELELDCGPQLQEVGDALARLAQEHS